MGTRGIIAKAKARGKNNGKEQPEKKVFAPNFEVYGDSEYYRDLDLLNNDKNREKFIKSIERIVRTSPEYRNYIRFLKTEAELAYCTVMNKLPEEISKIIKIEMHHYPITLYEIVDTILKKHLYLESDFTRLSVANEVMNNHFMNLIGIVPLTVTMHQMMHTGNNMVHHSSIFGNYKQFLANYDSFVDDNLKADVMSVEHISEATVERNIRNALSVNPTIFEELDLQDFHKITFKDREIEEEVAPESLTDIKPPKKKKPLDEIEEVSDELLEDEEVTVEIDDEDDVPAKDRAPARKPKKTNKILDEFEFDE